LLLAFIFRKKSLERREFFKSFKKPFEEKEQEQIILRPPYFSSESDFAKCIECKTKDCKIACDNDTSIIQIDEQSGAPILNFALKGCTYCDDCATACKEDILKIENRKNINAKFSIDLIKCLSWQDTMCFSCKDPCLDNAIEFLGLFKPAIKENLCTSCGFCLNVCPTDAIKIEI
jgi:ferredoxin-type protein NapF